MDYILPLLIIGGDDTTFCNSRLSKDQEAGESVRYEPRHVIYNNVAF